MINRIIHQVWIGPLPAPTKWMDTWPAKNPNWEYKVWGNDEVFGRKWHNQHLIDELVHRYEHEIKGKSGGQDLFISARGRQFIGEKATLFAWHIIADLLRYEILYEEGGYMPGADSICLRSIDDKFSDDIDLYTVRTGHLYTKHLKNLMAQIGGDTPDEQQQLMIDRFAYNNASPILAAQANHPFLMACLDELYKLKPEDLGEAVDTTGNVFMGKMITKYKPAIVMPSYTLRADRVVNNDYSMHYAGTTRNTYSLGRHATRTANLDIVIPLNAAENYEELRYTLRSIDKNMPHNRIWLVGARPDWAKNVGHIPTLPPAGMKYTKSGHNVRVACSDNRITDNFILMADDVFVMHPVTELQPTYKGRLVDIIKDCEKLPPEYRNYVHAMERTRSVLEQLGFDPNELKSYELHVPMIFNRERRILISKIQRLVNTGGLPVHANTLYYNFFRMDGKKQKDVKIFKNDAVPDPDALYISTSDASFANGVAGQYVRDQFPDKCQFELD